MLGYYCPPLVPCCPWEGSQPRAGSGEGCRREAVAAGRWAHRPARGPPRRWPRAHLPGRSQRASLFAHRSVPRTSGSRLLKSLTALTALPPFAWTLCHLKPLPSAGALRGPLEHLLQRPSPVAHTSSLGRGAPPSSSPPSSPFSQSYGSGFLGGYPALLKYRRSLRLGSETPVTVCSALVQRDAESCLTALSVNFHIQPVSS